MSATVLHARRELLEFTRPSTLTPGQARSWVRRILTSWGVPEETAGRAEVVVSELVTNACLHGPSDTPVTVMLHLVSAGVEVSVHDQGRIAPEQWRTAPGGESGRGLSIVRAMSRRFDVEMHQFGGKTCSAVLGLVEMGAAA